MTASKLLAILLVFAFAADTMAQQDTTSQRHFIYFNQVTSGILFGKKFTGNTVTVSTIHGVSVKRISVGIGLGYETYSERELMPMFGSFAFDLISSGAHHLFIEMDYGYSRAWHVAYPFDPYDYKERGGRLFQGCVGYRRRIERFSLYIKAGYKNQEVKYDQVVWWMPDLAQYIVRDMERVSLSIGFGMN